MNHAVVDNTINHPVLYMGFDITQILPFFAVFLIFYFLVIRPQTQKARSHKQLLDNLKSGMTVATTGGIIGKVIKTDGNEVVLEISPETQVRFFRDAIANVLKK